MEAEESRCEVMSFPKLQVLPIIFWLMWELYQLTMRPVDTRR